MHHRLGWRLAILLAISLHWSPAACEGSGFFFNYSGRVPINPYAEPVQLDGRAGPFDAVYAAKFWGEAQGDSSLERTEAIRAAVRCTSDACRAQRLVGAQAVTGRAEGRVRDEVVDVNSNGHVSQPAVAASTAAESDGLHLPIPALCVLAGAARPDAPGVARFVNSFRATHPHDELVLFVDGLDRQWPGALNGLSAIDAARPGWHLSNALYPAFKAFLQAPGRTRCGRSGAVAIVPEAEDLVFQRSTPQHELLPDGVGLSSAHDHRLLNAQETLHYHAPLHHALACLPDAAASDFDRRTVLSDAFTLARPAAALAYVEVMSSTLARCRPALPDVARGVHALSAVRALRPRGVVVSTPSMESGLVASFAALHSLGLDEPKQCSATAAVGCLDISSGLVLNERAVPFAVVHGLRRDPALRAVANARWGTVETSEAPLEQPLHGREPEAPETRPQASSVPKQLPHLDFVEVGTADFDTLLQAAGDAQLGMSVEPVEAMLARLPSRPNVLKVNAAVSNADGETSVYHVPRERTAALRLPWWVNGCSTVGAPHPMVAKLLEQRNLSLAEVVEVDAVPMVRMATLLGRHAVRSIGLLKLDCEGHDARILRDAFAYFSMQGVWPGRIQFEANDWTPDEEVAELLALYALAGYVPKHLGWDILLTREEAAAPAARNLAGASAAGPRGLRMVRDGVHLAFSYADDRFGHKGGAFTETQRRMTAMWARHPEVRHARAFSEADLLRPGGLFAQHPWMLAKRPTDQLGNMQKAWLFEQLLRHDVPDGAFVLYHDASPEIWDFGDGSGTSSGTAYHTLTLRRHLEACAANGGILMSSGFQAFPSWRFTSRPCLEHMGAAHLGGTQQFCTCWVLLQNTARVRAIVAQWLAFNREEVCYSYALHRDQMRDELPGFPQEGFYEHRGDQSILSLLLHMHGMGNYTFPANTKNIFSWPNNVTGVL